MTANDVGNTNHITRPYINQLYKYTLPKSAIQIGDMMIGGQFKR